MKLLKTSLLFSAVLAVGLSGLVAVLQYRCNTNDRRMSESEMLNTVGAIACVDMRLQSEEGCNNGVIDDCPNGAGCTVYTCRAACSSVTSYTSCMIGVFYTGYLTSSSCSAEGSTYSVLDCTGIVWCDCDGAVISSGNACPSGSPYRRDPC
jgi:hypothetical protein